MHENIVGCERAAESLGALEFVSCGDSSGFQGS